MTTSTPTAYKRNPNYMNVAMEVCLMKFNTVNHQVEHNKKASTAMTTIKTLLICQSIQHLWYFTQLNMNIISHSCTEFVLVGQRTNTKKCTLRVKYSSFMCVCVCGIHTLR